MISQQSEFQDLIDRIRAGEQRAAWELVEQYGPHILRTVRRKLNRQLRSKFDSQDFVQAVWASFFADDAKVNQIETPEQLIALLAAIARHKIVDQIRKRMYTEKHDVSRERSLDDSRTNYTARIASQLPTASDIVIAREQWDRLVRDQPERYQQIIELRFRGETLVEIADRLEINERTVRRVLSKLLRGAGGMSAHRESAWGANTPGLAVAPHAEVAREVASQAKVRWHNGEPPDAFRVISQHAELDWQRSIRLDLIYEEYCQRVTTGERVDVESLCQRFPDLRSSIYRQVEVHRFLESHPGLTKLEHETAWPAPGDQLFQFAILQEMGRGAFGRVYLCSQAGVGDRLVVVKATFQRTSEADTLGRLSHPNIVPIYSLNVDEESRLTVICMPFRGRATLGDVIDLLFANGGSPRRADEILQAVRRLRHDDEPDELSDETTGLPRRASFVDGVIHMGVQLAEGLQHAHEKGIIHGDLKPSNVLITSDGRPMILDFNLAHDRQLAGGASGGTLPYMSPEQIRSTVLAGGEEQSPCDEKSDIYSLGVVLYESLCGHYPFGHFAPQWDIEKVALELLHRQQNGPADVTTRNPQVDVRLAALVGRCLAWEPESRPASMQQIGDELRRFTTPLRRLGRWQSIHRRWIFGVLLLALLAVVGVGALLISRPPPSIRAYRQGVTHLQAGEHAEAVAQFNEALQDDPVFADALFARGLAHLRADRLSSALEDFVAAGKIRQDKQCSAYCGYCLSRMNHSAAAILWYQRALDAGLRSTGILNNLGYSYYRANKLDLAADHLTEAINLDDSSPVPYFNRSLVDLRRASADRNYVPRAGINDIERVIQLQPDNGPVHFVAARLYGYAATTAGDNSEYANLGLQYLETAWQQGGIPESIVDLKTDPAFAAFQKNPKFETLTQQPRPDFSANRLESLMQPLPAPQLSPH